MMTAWLCVIFAEVVVVAIIVEMEVVRFELARSRCVDEAPETTNTRWVAVGAEGVENAEIDIELQPSLTPKFHAALFSSS